ncbi:MAG: creatininase family protein [Spirochaetaceae bacterium]|nr:creatininase family protein [Spirochaetaceae bacterium]
MKKRTALAAELSWTEFEEKMKEHDLIIIPIGMLESHGTHNPLGVDTIIAEYLANKIAERAGALASPVFPYGYGPEGRRFPGQVSLDPQLLRKIWYAYGASYARHGGRRFMFINGHGGNSGILRMTASDLWRDYGVLCSISEWWVLVPQIAKELDCADHGGLYETSCVLAIRPDLVAMDQARPPVPDAYLSRDIHSGHAVTYKDLPVFAAVDDYSMGRAGNLGNPPEKASAELGKKVLEVYIDYHAGLAGEMRKVELQKDKP